MSTSRRRGFPLLITALLPLLATAPSASIAQVRRCTAADGSLMFTDRRCEDVGAVARLPRDPQPGSSLPAYRGGCARTLQDLVYGVTSAIDSGDANRLATLYHWTGMSNGNGYATLARLDVIAQRPLVDAVLVQPQRAVVVRHDDGSTTTVDPDYYPQVARQRLPVGLRLEQTLANGSTPSRTTFALRRHLDCWWIAY